METANADVVIVGAGIAGSALAYRLGLEGLKVTLLDHQPPGNEASGGYAGLLTTVADGHSSGAYAELSQMALQYTLDVLPGIEQRSGMDVELMQTPLLRLADDENGMNLLRQYSLRPDAIAAGDRWLDGQQLRQLYPNVSTRVSGAILSGNANHLMPRALLAATLAACDGLTTHFDRAVVKLHMVGERVTGVVDASGKVWHAGHVVLANGAWGAELLAQIGLQLQLKPVRGQLLVLDGAAVPELPYIINTGRGYVVPKRGRRIVVGATHEEVGFEKAMTLSGMLHLSRVAGLLPGMLGLPIAATFVGLRPMSPDGMPLLGGAAGIDGLSMALGYGQHGVLLANLCAHLCALHITGQDTGALWPNFQAQRAFN